MSALLWVPAAWVSIEYLIAVVTSVGSWLSLANSQVDLRPVLGIAALAGGWGITFLLFLVPALVAVLAAQGIHRTQIAVVAAVPLIGGLAYGGWTASRPPSPERLRVAMIALPEGDGDRDPATPAGQALLAGYLKRISALSGSGVHLAVLPENTLTVDAATRPRIYAALRTAGAQANVDVVLGTADTSPAGTRNLAVLLPRVGPAVEYAKARLIPGVENEYSAGNGVPVFASVSGVPIRLLICKDLDFPDLIRATDPTRVLVAPSWDFDVDGRLHSRMAVLRGVENGVALVRPSRDRELLVSSPNGKIIAEQRQAGTETGVATGTTELIADVPLGSGRTPYSRWGDWLPWLCLLTAGAVLLDRLIAGRSARSKSASLLDQIHGRRVPSGMREGKTRLQ